MYICLYVERFIYATALSPRPVTASHEWSFGETTFYLGIMPPYCAHHDERCWAIRKVVHTWDGKKRGVATPPTLFTHNQNDTNE